MDDDFMPIVVAIVIFVAVLFGLYQFSEFTDQKRQESIHAVCQERYGKEWVGKYTYRNPDMCINAQGDVKYLQ
jgi:uncharacterized membrane protein